MSLYLDEQFLPDEKLIDIVKPVKYIEQGQRGIATEFISIITNFRVLLYQKEMGKIVKIDHRKAKIYKPKRDFDFGFYIGIFMQFVGIIFGIIAAIGFFWGLHLSKIIGLLASVAFFVIMPLPLMYHSIFYYTVIQGKSGLFKISARRCEMKSFIEVLKYVKRKNKLG